MTPEDALAPFGLTITGHLDPRDLEPQSDLAQIALVGADGERMWSVFAESREYSDGRPHPMDRWSARVIGEAADRLGAVALFPFSGPPWQPFQRWASLGEGAKMSPVAMQVSPTRGLWMSYRGALGFAEPLYSQADRAPDPCLDCASPCLTACPIDAFGSSFYDVPACANYISTAEGSDCLSGCKVRLACPVGTAPPLAQRQFHMSAFLGARPAASPGNQD